MRRPTQAEAFVAPELTVLPALLWLLDASLVLLHVQHPQLDRGEQDTDGRALCAARALATDIARTRRALLRYRRAARRAVRDTLADHDAELNF